MKFLSQHVSVEQEELLAFPLSLSLREKKGYQITFFLPPLNRPTSTFLDYKVLLFI